MYIGDSSLTVCEKALLQVCCHAPQLHTLKIGHACDSDGPRAALGELQRLTHLTHLSLPTLWLVFEGGRPLARPLSHLRTLSVRGEVLRSPFCDELLRALMAPALSTHLSTLVLEGVSCSCQHRPPEEAALSRLGAAGAGAAAAACAAFEEKTSWSAVFRNLRGLTRLALVQCDFPFILLDGLLYTFQQQQQQQQPHAPRSQAFSTFVLVLEEDHHCRSVSMASFLSDSPESSRLPLLLSAHPQLRIERRIWMDRSVRNAPRPTSDSPRLDEQFVNMWDGPRFEMERRRREH
jgi:hypothetical protein